MKLHSQEVRKLAPENDLVTRPNMSIKAGRKHYDMRMLGRIVGAHSA